MQNISVIFLSMRTVKNAYFLFDRQTKILTHMWFWRVFALKWKGKCRCIGTRGRCAGTKRPPKQSPRCLCTSVGSPAAFFMLAYGGTGGGVQPKYAEPSWEARERNYRCSWLRHSRATRPDVIHPSRRGRLSRQRWRRGCSAPTMPPLCKASPDTPCRCQHVLHLLQAASLVPQRLLGCFWLFYSLEVASRQKNTTVPISLKFPDRGTRSSCSQPHRALSLSCSSKILRANTKPCSSCSRNGNFPFPYFQCHVGK